MNPSISATTGRSLLHRRERAVAGVGDGPRVRDLAPVVGNAVVLECGRGRGDATVGPTRALHPAGARGILSAVGGREVDRHAGDASVALRQSVC